MSKWTGGHGLSLRYDIFSTPLGWVGVVSGPGGLRRSSLPQPSPQECLAQLAPDVNDAVHDPEALAEVRVALQSYLQGEVVSLEDFPLDLEDAPGFSRAAWLACRRIPRGETRSYRWLAAQAGRPGASRAAGQAMARNRLPLLVPCHRVVASNGGLGGFGRGARQLGLKRHLLRLEGALP